MPFLSLFLPIFSFLFLEWNCYWIHVVVVVVCLLLAPPFSSPTLFGWDEYLLYPRLIAWATAGQQWQMCVLAPTSLELIQPCVCVCVCLYKMELGPAVCVCVYTASIMIGALATQRLSFSLLLFKIPARFFPGKQICNIYQPFDFRPREEINLPPAIDIVQDDPIVTSYYISATHFVVLGPYIWATVKLELGAEKITQLISSCR